MPRSEFVAHQYQGLNSRGEVVSGEAYPYTLLNGGRFDMRHIEMAGVVLGAVRVDNRGIWDADLVCDPLHGDEFGIALIDHKVTADEQTMLQSSGIIVKPGIEHLEDILH